MKWFVSGIIFLSAMNAFSSASIIALEAPQFSLNLYCDILSDLGYPTGDKLSVNLFGNDANGSLIRQGRATEMYSGQLIDYESDPVVQKTVSVTGRPAFGIKFLSPNTSDNSSLRLVVIDDGQEWLESYLILTVTTTQVRAGKGFDEDVIQQEDARCAYL